MVDRILALAGVFIFGSLILYSPLSLWEDDRALKAEIPALSMPTLFSSTTPPTQETASNTETGTSTSDGSTISNTEPVPEVLPTTSTASEDPVEPQNTNQYIPPQEPTGTHPENTAPKTVYYPAVTPSQSAERILDKPVVPISANEFQNKLLSPKQLEYRERLKQERLRLEMAHKATLRFNTAIKNVVENIDETINTTIGKEVDRAVDIKYQQSDIKAFDPSERKIAIDRLRQQMSVGKQQLETGVRETLVAEISTESNTRELESVLKSPLEEINLLLNAEAGAPVDLSITSRKVESVILKEAKTLESEHSILKNDGALSLYEDADKDGVSDYDEERVYFTDPLNAHTAGSVLTDGERILVGLDARENTPERISVESPQISPDEAISSIFEISDVSLVSTTRVAEKVSIDSAVSTSSQTVIRESVFFAGRALPHSFVTLYVYSTPIVVTVRTDGEGSWKYVLDKELEDGDHSLYVATVNNEGRIIARSPGVPFIKTAEAIEFTPFTLPIAPDSVSLVDVFVDNLLLVGVLLLLSVGVIAILIVGTVQYIREKRAPQI